MTVRGRERAGKGSGVKTISGALLLASLGCGVGAGKIAADNSGGASGSGQAGAAGGTGGTPSPALTPLCGNGEIESGEACDDGNASPSDGCGATCAVEPGWACEGVPSLCNQTHSSCIGLTVSCGASTKACCGSDLVIGGTFQRDNVTDASFAATVADFWLDTYEVTVGRFAQFVVGYPASKPTAGSGRNPRNPTDPGWDPAWNAFLPADQATLTANVQCDAVYQTWGNGDNLAMNCVTWFEANAFCVWDGGRLPTSAEWNYAAAGGAEQRYYPWSNPSADQTIDPSYAVFSPATFVALVGSTSPKGDGKYGQSDLAGNVWEWVQDWYVPYYTSACSNCAALVQPPDTTERVIRGGSSYDDASYLGSASIDVYNPTTRLNYIGFRCARARQ